MSTHAKIIVRDKSGDELYFYKHWGGSPDDTMPVLEFYLDSVKSGKLRDNVTQSAGWLIIFGHQDIHTGDDEQPRKTWKVGSIEPSVKDMPDCDYEYTVDLSEKTINVSEK